MNTERFNIGDPVLHMSFGHGTVIQDSGEQTVIVQFNESIVTENTDTIEVFRELLSKVGNPKRIKIDEF